MVAFFNSNKKVFFLKIYNRTNFFKHTYCDFILVDESSLKIDQMHFKSKTGSSYFYTKEGVYRYSNHWGRVANCKWKLISEEQLKSQLYYIGFAKWIDFYSINETEKLFYITVNFETKKTAFHHKKERKDVFLFFSAEARKRIAQIKVLLKEEKWAHYFDLDIETLREKMIIELITTNKTLQQIKLSFT